MKKISLFATAFTAIAFMSSCGGHSETAAESTEETMVEEVAPMMTEINLSESSVIWDGTVVGVYTHMGTVNLTEGSLEMTGDAITGGKFVVDMNSMVATDENYNPEEGKTPEKLIGHLKSADFFLVDSFPTATFVIKSADMANNTITGDLTVRGTTNEEVIENVSFNQEAGEAKGTLTFNRQDYGVAFTHPLKDVVLANDINLNITLKK